jgi:hypothetical protein
MGIYSRDKKRISLTKLCLCVILAASLALFSLKILHSSRKPINKAAENFQKWSIGIYTGNGPFNLAPTRNITNPVLKASDVTDRNAVFVADPFMVKNNGKWYMFFEVFDKSTNQGDIGYAESVDGHHWRYKGIVIDEPFHLSYPYIFEYDHDYYIIPESNHANSIRLYKADKFPSEWKFVGTLISGKPFRDTCIVRFNDIWWIFTSSTPKDTLRLYYSDHLLGPWIEHPSSPIINGDPNIARSGGRIIVMDGKLIRFAQDCDPTYGNSIHAFIITEINKSKYSEKPADKDPIIGPTGIGWNKDGMHTIDPHHLKGNDWIACVDGWKWDKSYR